MTPNDLEAYLVVLNRQNVGAAVVELPGNVRFSVTFIPKIPLELGTVPEPGGWKSPRHLDNVEDLRPYDGEHKGELP